jgi:glycosyltransferase involved in cell wall biosynthesis
MRILFCSQNGYYPIEVGGIQSSTRELVRQARALGQEAAILAGYGRGRKRWYVDSLRALRTRSYLRDQVDGAEVYRAHFAHRAVASVVRTFQPEVAIVQGRDTMPIAHALRAQRIPTVIYVRDVEFDEQPGIAEVTRLTRHFISNSQFTARRLKERFGVDSHVIPPSIEPSAYRVTPRGERVVFINPVQKKGVEKALEIAARCREIPFLFVESWTLSPQDLAALQARLASLPNVTFMHRTSDMKSVYAHARIVLAPSAWEEAWGRIASEAHISGIPVVGSDRGGLPEAIGPGGVVVPSDAPIESWVEAVRGLWSDDARHRACSGAALAYAQRPELDAREQTRQLIAILQQTAR